SGTARHEVSRHEVSGTSSGQHLVRAPRPAGHLVRQGTSPGVTRCLAPRPGTSSWAPRPGVTRCLAPRPLESGGASAALEAFTASSVPALPRRLVPVFAIAAGPVAANLYYPQPLLVDLRPASPAGPGTSGWVPRSPRSATRWEWRWWSR